VPHRNDIKLVHWPLTYLVDEHSAVSALPAPIAWKYLISNFPPSAVEFSGCRLTDLELTIRNSRFSINTAVVPAAIENFPISTIVHLLALY